MPLDEQSYLLLGDRGEVAYIPTKEATGTAVWLEVAIQDVDGGGLSCPVLTQQTQDAATGHVEVQIFVYKPFPVIVGKVVTTDYRLHDCFILRGCICVLLKGTKIEKNGLL
jgi:hypothetical protein